jgi:hypothetical protein
MLQSKRSRLIAGILFDLIGMMSYLVPVIGELTDVIWAPISGYLMTRLYPGKKGLLAGTFATIEELMPGMDIIPSFTIMWFYTYVINAEKEKKKNTTNYVEVE